MKSTQKRKNGLPSSTHRLRYKATGLLKRCLLVLCCLVVVGCDRYSQKPLCSTIIDDKDLGTFAYGPIGTAFDWKTSTIWYRCPGGSYFSQGTCSGDRLKLSWLDAVAYATELSEISGLEWRLATLPEIRSIISPDCVGPAVNRNVFPTLKSANTWTSSESSMQSDAFRCAIYTYNGAFSCRQLKRIAMPFLLVHDSSDMLMESSLRRFFLGGESEAIVPLDTQDIGGRQAPRFKSH
ncbi:MAG: hypothetical protein ACI9MF_001929 [Gammaproteobacteria bacterium]|jgi:hypothetical protein